MKLPIKPKAPSKPTEPQEFFPVENNVSYAVGCDGTYTLKELLGKLPKDAKPEDLKFRVHYTYSGDDYDDGKYLFDITYITMTKATDYISSCKKYKKKLSEYEKKMEAHKVALVKYEEEMKVYNAWLKIEKTKEDIKELEKLKKAVKALEKKVAK